jgi:signal transduction histidine kinase/DNA-binding NarL/FixJ family response regulator
MITLRRLFIRILLVGCVAIIVVGVILLWQERERSEKQWRYDTISRSVESTSTYYSSLLSKIILEQSELLKSSLDNIKKNEKLISVSIIPQMDLDQSVLATCQNDYKGPYFFQMPTCYHEDKEFFTIYHELRSAGQSLGYLAKQYPIAEIGMFNRKQFVYELLVILLAFVSVSTVSLFYLHRYVMRPMIEIADTIKREKQINISPDSFKLLEINVFIRALKQAFDEIKAYQETVTKNTELASIGQSTAMVAHDVRKPLASMKALLTMLPQIKDNPEQVRKMAASVDRNIERTNVMLNDILEFSRDSAALELKNHNPQSIITSALVEALRNHAGSNVSIEYELYHKDYLYIDGDRIIRVLSNIIENALDAISGSSGKADGKIWIKTKDILDEGLNRFMRITIGDNGRGIPQDIRAKIFDPFFTHGKKGGTGLGLSICQKVIQMHGGKIEAKSKEAESSFDFAQNGQRETEFIIELPAHAGQLSINESELIHYSSELRAFREEEAARVDYGDTANTAEFMRINKKRARESYLLIVDDEPLFRETVRSLLNGLSQMKDHVKVIETDNAENALELFEKREFDYVIADIDLGKRRMNGYEFVQIVLGKYRNTYVLIHSNKRKDELDKNIRHIASERFMGFLPKPMKASELLQFLACKTFEVSGKAASQIQKRKNVLVVNDEDFMRVGLKYTLGHFGDVHVIEASGVGDALTMMAKNKVDIILSDINLGEGKPDGYELLKNIRQRSAHAVKFYMISGYPKESEEHKAVSRGADGYCQLPLEDDQLRRILEL